MEKKLLLFDIDGTLVKSGNPTHGRAFMHAIRKRTGKDVPVTAVDPNGRTDAAIVVRMLALAGLDEREARDSLPSVFDEMVRYYVAREGDLRSQVLGGVRRTLNAVTARGNFVVGLLTGNHEELAWHKLECADLRSYFTLGSFGNESESRADLVALARERARREAGGEFGGRNVVVIGDTPRDIECGRSSGAAVVAVATGTFSCAELAPHGPDLLLESLEETERLLEFLGG